MSENDTPRALRLDAAAGTLRIEWGDGAHTPLSFRLLRSRCRCAECRRAQRRGEPVGAGEQVLVRDVVPFGPNAVQLVFSDGHARGIFPFSYLRELATLACANDP